MRIFDTAGTAALALTLTAASLGTAHATFPGENGVVVYTNGDYLYRIEPGSGQAPTRLIMGRASQVGGPAIAVSPNGKKVAYSAAPAAINESRSSIRVMNIDGSNDRELVADGYMPAWMADGFTLAYLRNVPIYDWLGRRSRQTNLVLLDTRTQTQRGEFLVASGRLDQARLDASPLSESLVVSTYNGHGMRYSAGQWVSLSSNMYLASYRPDGKGLVGATGDESGYYSALEDCLSTMDLNGANLKQLSCSGAWGTVSPDGTQYLVSRVSGTEISLGSIASGAENFFIAGYRTAWSRRPMTAMQTVLASGNWTAPAALANDSDTYISKSAMAVMPDNGVNGTLRRAVGIGPDGRVVERAQGLNNTWSGWTLVPGLVGKTAEGVRAKQVAIAGALDGSVQVAIVGEDDLVYHALRDAQGKWSGFVPLDGAYGAANFAARDVSIAITRNAGLKINTAHIVANGLAEGQVFHRVRWADGSWTRWAMVSNEPAQTGSVAIATADNDDAYLLVSSPTQGLMRKVRYGYDGSWSGWATLSNPPEGPVKDVSLAIRGYGVSNSEAHVSYVDAKGKVWYRAVPSPRDVPYWTNPVYQPTEVMGTGGRSVSVGYSASTGVELLAVQAQPQ